MSTHRVEWRHRNSILYWYCYCQPESHPMGWGNRADRVSCLSCSAPRPEREGETRTEGTPVKRRTIESVTMPWISADEAGATIRLDGPHSYEGEAKTQCCGLCAGDPPCVCHEYGCLTSSPSPSPTSTPEEKVEDEYEASKAQAENAERIKIACTCGKDAAEGHKPPENQEWLHSHGCPNWTPLFKNEYCDRHGFYATQAQLFMLEACPGEGVWGASCSIGGRKYYPGECGALAYCPKCNECSSCGARNDR